MRPRHWAKLTSASALAIILGCLPLRAETPLNTDATLGIPLPELHTKQITWAADQARDFEAYMRANRDPDFTADGAWPVRTAP